MNVYCQILSKSEGLSVLSIAGANCKITSLKLEKGSHYYAKEGNNSYVPYLLSTPMGADYVVIGFDMEVQPLVTHNAA